MFDWSQIRCCPALMPCQLFHIIKVGSNTDAWTYQILSMQCYLIGVKFYGSVFTIFDSIQLRYPTKLYLRNFVIFLDKSCANYVSLKFGIIYGLFEKQNVHIDCLFPFINLFLMNSDLFPSWWLMNRWAETIMFPAAASQNFSAQFFSVLSLDKWTS